MQNYLSDKEKQKLMDFGKSRAWTKGQTISFLQHRNHKAYVAAEQAKFEAEQAKKMEEAKVLQELSNKEISEGLKEFEETVQINSKEEQDAIVIGKNKHGHEYKLGEFEMVDGEWHHEKLGSVKDNMAGHYADVLAKHERPSYLGGGKVLTRQERMYQDVKLKGVEGEVSKTGFRPIINKETNKLEWNYLNDDGEYVKFTKESVVGNMRDKFGLKTSIGSIGAYHHLKGELSIHQNALNEDKYTDFKIVDG